MIVKLLTEHHLEFLSLKGGCIGWSESTPVKMPNCWKSHAMAHNHNFGYMYVLNKNALFNSFSLNNTLCFNTDYGYNTVMLWLPSFVTMEFYKGILGK